MARSILVSGLPKDIAEEKLTIYFQKSKNGGGDVAKVEMREGGTVAIVEFDEVGTVDSVMQHSHKIGGNVLNVKRYKSGDGTEKVFSKIEAEICDQTLQSSGINLIGLYQLGEELNSIDILKRGKSVIVTSDSFEEMCEFEKKFKTLSKKRSKGPRPRPSPHSQPLHHRNDKSPVRPPSPVNRTNAPSQPQKAGRPRSPSLAAKPVNAQRQPGVPTVQPRASALMDLDGFQPNNFGRQQQPPAFLDGAASMDSLSSVWTDKPFQQPEDGRTLVVEGGGDTIKRMFYFDQGAIPIPGDVIQYTSFECIVSLPNNQAGKIINQMLNEAFEKRKLFYIARNTSGPGFKIQCSYNMFGSITKGDEIDLSSKLMEIKGRLNDLGIETPKLKKPDKVPGTPVRDKMPPPEPMEACAAPPVQQTIPRRAGPFPQPEDLQQNSEYHRKDLPKYPGVGTIHMYFRFAGGSIETQDDNRVHYVSYNRTACLPGNAEGRKLYAMIMKAANEKKLFVVASKAGTFMIRTKVPLLTSDDDLDDKYIERLYASLLKLGIEPPNTPPPLPQQVEAHYEEVSDDEEEHKQREMLKKGGPFPQPDNGVIRMEKEDRNLNGFGAGGTIKVYFRFAGGKMKIEGSKPSKSFEVQFSQMNTVAALPGSDNGKRLAYMLKACFEEKKLFYVEKRDGEPSFRVRPNVTLLTTENHPKPEYLAQLRRQLLSLGVEEPTDKQVASLAIYKSTTPQGGPLPADWVASSISNSTQQNINPPSVQPQPQPRFVAGGARRKMQGYNAVPHYASPTPSTQIQQKRTYSQRKPGFAGNFGCNAQSDSNDANNMSCSDYSSPPSQRTSSFQSRKEEEDKCAICLASLGAKRTKKLPCNHEFHVACIDMALKAQPKCPYCNQPVNSSGSPQPQPAQTAMTNLFQQPRTSSPVFSRPYGFPQSPAGNNPAFPPNLFNPPKNVTKTGNQRVRGTMNHHIEHQSLPGFEGCNTIVIRYVMIGGVQEHCHPNPGVHYDGTRREAYLPNNAEGQDLLRLLKRAFDSGLTFTVGQSQSNGRDNQIIWNGIPHRTNRNGGRHSYGYPDPGYLSELRKHLASIGIR